MKNKLTCSSLKIIAKKRNSISKLLIKKKISKKKPDVSEIELLCFYDVDVILKERFDKYGEVEYFVSWKGYSSDNDSWIKSSWSINQENVNYIPNTKDLYMLATIACNEVQK